MIHDLNFPSTSILKFLLARLGFATRLSISPILLTDLRYVGRLVHINIVIRIHILGGYWCNAVLTVILLPFWCTSVFELIPVPWLLYLFMDIPLYSKTRKTNKQKNIVLNSIELTFQLDVLGLFVFLPTNSG